MRIGIHPLERGAEAMQAAELLAESFACYAAPGKAQKEIESCLEEGKIALVAVCDGAVLGFIGGMPQYGTTGWELHPLAVRWDTRGKGVGARLVRALEVEAAKRGCVTLYLGTDDEDGRTSLSGCNLFEDPFQKIARVQNKGRHPYEFYQKQGFQIVGVIPDANGLGKPDIYMAKSLARG